MVLLQLLGFDIDVANIIKTAIWIYGILFVIYIIGSLVSSGNIIKSIKPGQEGFSKADLIYYLPTANLQILATAKIIIKTNIETSQIEPELAELSLQITIQIVPDTDHPFALKYYGFWFSKDTFKVTINSSGLLEGINLTAEDRLSNIVTAIADSSKTIFSAENDGLVKADLVEEKYTTEIKEYSKTFFISASEIENKASDCLWMINLEGKALFDASFYLNFQIPDRINGTTKAVAITVQEGVLVRPLHTMTMRMYRLKQDRDSEKDSLITTKYLSKSELIIPDESSVVPILVKRSAFVTKVYGMKFTNGFLTENSIDKPSEIEGFISIPIKVAKAIISIPAQLIQFRIVNIKNQTSLETTQQALQKAQLDSRKNEITLESDSLKAKLEAEKNILDAQKNLITEQKMLLTASKEFQDELKKLKDGK